MCFSVQLPNTALVIVETVKRNRREKIPVHISTDSITLSHQRGKAYSTFMYKPEHYG